MNLASIPIGCQHCSGCYVELLPDDMGPFGEGGVRLTAVPEDVPAEGEMIAPEPSDSSVGSSPHFRSSSRSTSSFASSTSIIFQTCTISARRRQWKTRTQATT